MGHRYYICGQVGSGTELDPYRPEIADDLPEGCGWAANQEMSGAVPNVTPLPQFMVMVASDDAALHALLAYAKKTNPNGYDYFEIAEDGSVTYAAK